jgi:hypothetical protein
MDGFYQHIVPMGQPEYCYILFISHALMDALRDAKFLTCNSWKDHKGFSSPSVADRWFSASRTDVVHRFSTLHNHSILFISHA